VDITSAIGKAMLDEKKALVSVLLQSTVMCAFYIYPITTSIFPYKADNAVQNASELAREQKKGKILNSHFGSKKPLFAYALISFCPGDIISFCCCMRKRLVSGNRDGRRIGEVRIGCRWWCVW
jgi:hypothetical protein